jgi:hypothetical protein
METCLLMVKKLCVLTEDGKMMIEERFLAGYVDECGDIYFKDKKVGHIMANNDLYFSPKALG